MDSAIKACRHFLGPIVRFLLRQGVTWDQFSDLAKDVFVQVAREDYGIAGRPTNNSRVAMLTGLSRREVARVRDRLLEGEEDPNLRQGNRISKILGGWHEDPEFTDKDGQPKDLPLAEPTGSWTSLLNRYAGDLPHSALKKEMLQRGLIGETGNGELRVLHRDYVYSDTDPEIIEQMSVALHDHAATLEHNLNVERKSPPRFEAIADNSNLSPQIAEKFLSLVESRGMDFLREIDGWLSGNEMDESEHAAGRNIRLGVGVYLICDEANERQSQ